MYDILGKMRLMEGKGSKPDFLDLDKDGDRKENMKDAAKDADQGVAEADTKLDPRNRLRLEQELGTLIDKPNPTMADSARAIEIGKIIGRSAKLLSNAGFMSIGRMIDLVVNRAREKSFRSGAAPEFTSQASTARDLAQQIALHTQGSYDRQWGRTWTDGYGRRIKDPDDYVRYKDQDSYDDAMSWIESKGRKVHYRDRSNQLRTAIQIGKFIVEPGTVVRGPFSDNPTTTYQVSVRSVKAIGSGGRTRADISDQQAAALHDIAQTKSNTDMQKLQAMINILQGEQDLKNVIDRSSKIEPKDKAKLDAIIAGAKNFKDPGQQGVAEGSTGDYSAKKARAGKDIGKPGKQFSKIASDAAKRYGSKERGEKVAGAVLAKLRAKESIDEADMEEGNRFTGNLMKARAAGKKQADLDGDGDMEQVREGFNSPGLESILDKHAKDVSRFKATGELSDSLYDALFGEWMNEMPYGIAKARTGDPYQWISDKLEDVLDGSMDESLDMNLLKGLQGAMSKSQKDPESERNIHKKYGHRSDRDDDGGDDDDYDEFGNFRGKKKSAHVVPGEKRGRGRPKGSGRAIGAKGPTGKSKLLAREDRDEEADAGEYGREGDMAKEQLHTIEAAAKELHSILHDEQDLPEWVQSKITKAMDYIDTARDYMASQEAEDEEEMVAEKAVSVAQRRAAGIAHAAQKGEIPKSELRGASKEMAKMSKGELHKFAATKEKDLPEKKSKKKEESVEETTAGSVATAPAAEAPKGKKGGMQFGKSVYENKLAESFDNKLKTVLTEGVSINASQGEDGRTTLSVNATDEDAVKLAQILRLAGMPQGQDYHDVCPACGSANCGCEEVNEADLANAPDPVYGSIDMIKAQGEDLHKPKSTGQTTTPVISRDPARQGVMREGSDKESALWNLYKRIQ